MRRSIIFLHLLLILSIGTFSVHGSSLNYKNLKRAIEHGIKQYHSDGKEGSIGYAVFVVKIISCSKSQGEFSISYIMDDYELDRLKPSNYCMVDNWLILIKTGTLEPLFTGKGKFPIMNTWGREKAYSILAGPNLSILSQMPTIMIVTYKNRKVTTRYLGPGDDEKYWHFSDKQ